jgi:hypothetical protein
MFDFDFEYCTVLKYELNGYYIAIIWPCETAFNLHHRMLLHSTLQ